MLQQILREMYIDPELLAELGEDQKQTLFCRMREEQVRRWRLWDSEQEKLALERGPKPERKAKVTFLEGSDGKPWTWVMGEHPDDKSIEQILEEEAREKARKMAEKETEKLRRSVEAELSEILVMNQKEMDQLEKTNAINRLKEKAASPAMRVEDGAQDIYCSVDEPSTKMQVAKPFQNERTGTERGASQDGGIPNYRSKVAATVAQWEKRVTEERTSQIFDSLQKKLLQVAKEAEAAEEKQERLWREQEKKAKMAERHIREIARRAREEHRRTARWDPEVFDADGVPRAKRAGKEAGAVAVGTARPRNREAIAEWFRTCEYQRRAAVDERNRISPWFHGIISRQEAELVLADKPVGNFLVRISERIWGYAISYRDADRCKHYLIDASNGRYQFLGPNQMVHRTLGELVSFHERNAITLLGGELLTTPCPPSATPEVFRGLPFGPG